MMIRQSQELKIIFNVGVMIRSHALPVTTTGSLMMPMRSKQPSKQEKISNPAPKTHIQ